MSRSRGPGRQTHGFDIPTGVRYLNCAFMAPLHREVEEAGIEGIRRKRRPFEIDPSDFHSGGILTNHSR